MEQEQRLIDASLIPYDDNGRTDRFAVGIVPTVDAVPVVRCGKCLFQHTSYCPSAQFDQDNREHFTPSRVKYCGYGTPPAE